MVTYLRRVAGALALGKILETTDCGPHKLIEDVEQLAVGTVESYSIGREIALPPISIVRSLGRLGLYPIL